MTTSAYQERELYYRRDFVAYLPLSEARVDPNDTMTNYGYTGHKEIAYIKLVDMQARWYAPEIQRFISADTIVPDPTNPQSLNRYAYVLNNPVNLVDPTGNYGICFQQGQADQDSEDLKQNTPVTQMCRDLAEQGFFGASGMFDIFGNDPAGIEAALAWLVEMMVEHPDDPIIVLGYSYGGGGALEFADILAKQPSLLHLTASGFSSEVGIPDNVIIDALVLIDPVSTGRTISQNKYAAFMDHETVPSNVRYTLNLYATQDAYFGWWPHDQGLQDISGALNVGMQGTNHCTVASASCSFLISKSIPFPDPDREGPINPRTLYAIKGWLHELQLR
jgi:RHS repeat-associated protein